MHAVIPGRHPARPQRVPILSTLAAVARLDEPTPSVWQEMGEALQIGDPPMDVLLHWMHQEDITVTRPLFDQALQGGIASMPDAPEPLRAFFTRVETPPAWVDQATLRLGERTMRLAGRDAIYAARDVPFLGGYAVSAINQTLLRTKNGQRGETGSAQRFAETMRWALDIIDERGMAPGGPGYRSTLHVRLIHGFVRRHVGQLPDWSTDQWGVPVNQLDMAAVMLGALISPIMVCLPMGVVATPRELDAIAHVARYAGWLIGIDERWLANGFRDSVRLLHNCLLTLYRPDDTSHRLAAPMAADPLTWHYPRAQSLRRRIAWAAHLSLTSAFTGPPGMRRLGLPAYMPPWYPLVRMPINVVRTGLVRALPGGSERAARAGYRQQRAFMNTLIGPTTNAAIGTSANYFGH
jgi:ER-bound oxygenase mpaB/B'/Rubber oxygenase, catalytic domain